LQPTSFDLAFFAAFAGGHAPAAWVLGLAKVLAQYSAWALALALVVFVWRDKRQWLPVVGALLACWLGSLLAREISLLLNCPRPFMLGLSPNYIGHGTRGSFPSAHATALGSLLGALLCSARWDARRAAVLKDWFWLLPVSASLMVGTAWARFYVGVHFLSDVLAGMMLGLAFGFFLQVLLRELWRLAAKLRRWRSGAAAAPVVGDIP
jgi:membrane-associated phospholipid phosphatase